MPLDSIEVYVEQDDGHDLEIPSRDSFRESQVFGKSGGQPWGCLKMRLRLIFNNGCYFNSYIFGFPEVHHPWLSMNLLFGKEIVGSHHFNRGNFPKY
jgi:hypothetical protein